nr:MAG TPA: hypothetical protein [Caudoviricetes sp.]
MWIFLVVKRFRRVSLERFKKGGAILCAAKMVQNVRFESER